MFLALLAIFFVAIAFSILPGWVFVNQLKIDKLAKFLLATIISYLIMYLLEFTTYIVGLPHSVPFLICSFLSLFSLYLIRKNVEFFSWSGLLTWSGLSFWLLAIQATVVVYGAGSWYGDWYEHYERTLFFLNQLPSETRFLTNIWTLPARAPLFNSSAALVMAGLGDEFWVFQTISTVFNSITVLALALLIRDISKMKEISALLISAIICGFAPFAVQPELCTWTKFFTVAFILSGIYFYRLGAIENKPWVMGASFIIFALGILAHYLALAYIFFFACHFLYLAIKNRWNWKIVVYPVVISALLLFTWFGYCVAIFGFKATATANSTLGDYKTNVEGSNGNTNIPSASVVFLANTVSTIIPYSWRGDFKFAGTPKLSPQLDEQGEYFYRLANNSASILGALGWSGTIGFILASYFALRQKKLLASDENESNNSKIKSLAPSKYFWVTYFILGIPLNIFLHPTYAEQGLVVIHMQTYVCLLLVYLVSYLTFLNVLPKIALLGVFLAESSLALWATIVLQSNKLPLILDANGNAKAEGEIIASPIYVGNYIYKLSTKAMFVSDKFQGYTLFIFLLCLLIVLSILFIGVYKYKYTKN